MFTLSDKIRVVNSAADFFILDPANPATQRATSAAVVAGDRLLVEGFGDFDSARIAKMKMRRSASAVAGVSDFAIVAPTGLAVGDVVEVAIKLETGRYQSEVLTQNGIGSGRSFILQTAPLANITAADIVDAIVAAYDAWLASFTVGTPLLTLADGGTSVTVTGDALGSIDFKSFEIRSYTPGSAGSAGFWALMVETVTTEPSEGHGTGKFLEESVRMATALNNDPYGVDNASTQVDVRGSYTEVTFDYISNFDANLATNAADYGNTSVGGGAVGGVASMHSFTLFINENLIAADDVIDQLAALLVANQAVAPMSANVTLNVVAAPTNAEYLTEGLIIADGSTVDTSAAFIA